MSRQTIQVVPLRRFPRTKGIFDYFLDDGWQVKPGDLVQINFKNSLTDGVVFSLKPSSVGIKKLKPINKLLISGYVNKQQLKLVSWLANYSGVSLAAAMQLAAPFSYSKRLIGNYKVADKIKSQKVGQAINIVTGSAEQKKKIISTLVDKVTKRDQQVLLLVPEIRLIDYWAQVFNQPISKYSADDKITNKQLAWQNISTGQTKIIIGTRAALWLNFRNLGGIIIDEADNENYYQSEQNPRYDSLIVANELASICQASLAIVSYAPRLTNWYQVKNHQEDLQDFSKHLKTPLIIDLKTSRTIIKSGLISSDLKTEVDKRLVKKEKVLLYFNRRGGATTSICEDCGYTARCPKCQRALVLSNYNNKLSCFHCSYQQNLAIPCPACGSLRITYKGSGLDKLVAEIKQFWSNKKIITLEDKFDKQQIIEATNAEIIIGSRTAVRATNFLSLGLAVIVNADIELHLPEFNSAERLWQLARRLMALTKQVIIQTKEPDNYLFLSLAKKEVNYFYKAELELRKKYQYPPFVKLLKLTWENIDVKESQYEINETIKQLKKYIPQAAEIIGPYPDYYRLRNNKWRWHVLLKLPLNFPATNLWSCLPADVIIDQDPHNILS